jgi:nitric oxide synthase-interacting protein
MRRFDACALCLQRARDPIACQEGHLFCKECAYTDLRECPELSYHRPHCQTRSVAQKKDIKRQKERLEALRKEAEQEKARAKEAARERVLADFEKGQLALAAVPAVTTSGAEVAGNGVHITFFFLFLQ